MKTLKTTGLVVALALAVTLLIAASGQDRTRDLLADKEPAAWEYKVPVSAYENSEQLQKQLNQQAAEGWEYAGTIRIAGGNDSVILKRAKKK